MCAILLRTDRDAAARLVNSSDPRDSPFAVHLMLALMLALMLSLLPALQAESYTSALHTSLCHAIPAFVQICYVNFAEGIGAAKHDADDLSQPSNMMLGVHDAYCEMFVLQVVSGGLMWRLLQL